MELLIFLVVPVAVGVLQYKLTASCRPAWVKWIPFLSVLGLAVLTLLARPWGLVFAALLGSGAFSIPLWGWAILLMALTALFILAIRYSGRIEDRLLAWIYTI